MSHDARAKVRLKDGREVWRMVSYREVGSGRWVSAKEVDRLLPEDVKVKPGGRSAPRPDLEQIRQQIVDVQAQMALDKQAGAKATGAARLVLKTLNEMEQADSDEPADTAWFILGRQLAEQILVLIEMEKEGKTGIAIKSDSLA